jgi:DNA-binding response OmpR family regulator
MAYHALVVDDQRQIAENLADMIRLLGHSAEVIIGARPALKRLSERLPDMMFLDISMPGMDGLEMCRYLRGEHWTAKLPVVIVSVNDDLAHTDAAFQAGADFYLIKPVQLTELERIIDQITKRLSRAENKDTKL